MEAMSLRHISKHLATVLIELDRRRNKNAATGGMHGVANTVHKTGEDGLAVDSAGDNGVGTEPTFGLPVEPAVVRTGRVGRQITKKTAE